ncbi:MAG: hypothetical protein JWM68_2715, partial [Verrucomicrobiales bacterium]|nr:hypothetical protein [Verrucomicrobiales bacterium]
TAWTGAAGDNAIFEGTGGAVTGAAVPLKGIMFVKSSGYTFSATVNVGTVGATNDTASGVTNTMSGIISGSGSLTKNGSGVMILAAANTYTGGTFLNAGTLGWSPNTTTIGNNSPGVKVYINADNVVFANSGTASKTPQQAVDQLGDLICDDSLITNPAVINFSGVLGPWTIKGADRKITVNGAASLTIGNKIQDDGTPRTLTKAGAGLLTVSSVSNVFTGAIIVQSGPLKVANANGLGSASTGTTVNAGGALQVSGSGSAEPVSLDGTGANNDGALRSVAANMTFAGPVTLASSGVRINSDNSTFTLSGGITGAGKNLIIGGSGGSAVTNTGISIGSGTLTKDGSGTLTLNIPNSFSGTTISAGRVSIGDNSALSSGPITTQSGGNGQQLILNTSGLNITNALTINGGGVSAQGILYYNQTSGSATYSGPINITASASTGGHLASASGGTGELVLAGPLTSSVLVTMRNGSVTYSNPGNSFPSMSIQGGTCKIGVAGAMPGTATVDMAANGVATLDLNGLDQTVAALTKASATNAVNTANVINSGAGTPTLTVNNASAGIYWGVLGGTGNSFNVTKSGAGTWTLGGSSTYSGVTLVSAGTLRVTNITGSATSSGTVTVGSAGTLSGNGAVSGTVLVNGTVAPGDGVGTLATGPQTWAGSGHYAFEINQAAGTAGAINGWDLANITGGLTISATTGSKFVIDLSSVSLTDFVSTTNYSWSIARTTTGISGFDAGAFTVNTAGFTNTTGGGTFTVTTNATDVLLVFTASQGAAQPTSFTTSGAGQGSFNGTPNTTYTVQYADALDNPTGWQFLMSVTTSGAGLGSFVDPTSPSLLTNRFYRVKYP